MIQQAFNLTFCLFLTLSVLSQTPPHVFAEEKAETKGEANEKKHLTLTEISVTSQLDQSKQPSLIWVPEQAKSQPTPVFVFLHSWSGNYKQDNTMWLKEAVNRNWIYLHPNFRGANKSPQACGSKFARQDILDSLDYVLKNYNVDRSRIYLAGASGGGHMAMLMAGHHPERFSAVSAWVGISDIADWYRFHVKKGVPQNYAKMILKSLGQAPGKSKEIDLDYADRSPIFHLQNVGKLPIDLSAGVRDGHDGSVPIHHTMRAYNVIAKAHGKQLISDEEMDQLWNKGKLASPQDGDTVEDETYAREIHLRRKTDTARVTIFEGWHEGLCNPACKWLEKQKRATACE